MESKTRASVYTVAISVINSVAVILFNLIYNNCLIRIYGSQVNGLISTLTQFVSLFAIVEGGFTTAAVVATYEPIVNKNFEKLNNILYTTKRIYMRIGLVLTGSVLIAGSVYINFIDSPFDYAHTYALLFISVLTTASSLCFLSKYSVLVQGSNKEYIQIILSLVAKTITWIISMIMIVKSIDVILVYCINVVNVLLNVLLAKFYERKKYPYIVYQGKYDKEYIKGTEDVLFQKIANTIFTSTDLILISVCISLTFASVYNVYYQIFKAIFTLLSSIALAPFNSFGQLVRSEEGAKRVSQYFNIYQHLVLLISTITLSITGVLVIPFVRVYTARILDFNYIYPSLAVLFFSQIFAQIVNRPYGTILNATGNFKMQNLQCMLAAIVNIIVSVMFIRWWGINSIIFGSFIGTLIILGMNIYQTYKNVLNKSCFKVVKNIIANYVLSIFLIIISLQFNIQVSGYLRLVLFAIPLFFIIGIIVLAINFVVDKHTTLEVIAYVIGKVFKRGVKECDNS